MRIGLVGCVKSKRAEPAPARDLYVSTLFAGRRAFVEMTCDQWYVLSVKHGLVDPETVIEPYDVALATHSTRERRQWARAVIEELQQRVGDLGIHEFEIHAGSQYRNFGLVEQLEAAGASCEVPAEGLSQGDQLAFYQRGVRPPPRPAARHEPTPARSRPVPPPIGRRRGRPGGKYNALGRRLADCGETTLTLRFTAIDDLLGSPLPASARTYREWWANTDRSPQARSWLDSGYRVDTVDLMAGRVTFWRERRPKPVELPGPPKQAPGGGVAVSDIQPLAPFVFRWPGSDEQFARGWDFVASEATAHHRVRHALGSRHVFGRDRIHSVTWVAGSPQVEATAADDYEQSGHLVGLIKRPDGRDARSVDELPDGYGEFEIVVHREAVQGAWARRSLAVRIHAEDLQGWARHALIQADLRKARRRSGTESNPPSSPPDHPKDAELSPIPSDLRVPAVVNALLAHGETLASQGPANFATDPVADAFLRSDPFAFLIAVVFDQGIVAERAWAAPYLLRQRLGHLDPSRMAADPDGVRAAIAQPPSLHRYVENVPRWVVAASQRVLDVYGGNAEAIWNDQPTAVELRRRLEGFEGIGQKKAAMAVEILERDRGVTVRELGGSDVAFDVHIRRVFLRTGVAHADDLDNVVEQARMAYPERPGALDLPAWDIGRNWCRPVDPQCDPCPLGLVCPRLIGRADGVKGN